MKQLLIRLVVTAAALYLTAWLVPGIHHTGPAANLLLVALVLGLVNSLLRPLLTILTCPLIVLTLGFFTLVINAMLLLATAWLSRHWHLGFDVDGFWAAFLGGIILGLTSLVLTLAAGQKRR